LQVAANARCSLMPALTYLTAGIPAAFAHPTGMWRANPLSAILRRLHGMENL